MGNLFMIIFTLSTLALIIGIIKPSVIKLSSRTKALKVLLPIMLVSVILGASLLETDDEASNQEENDEEVEAEEQQEEEEEFSEDDQEESKENSEETGNTEQNDEENESNEDETEEVDASTEETEEDIEETDESEMSQEDLEDSALMILRDNFGEMADLELDRDNKTFFLTPTDEAFKDELNYMAESGEVLEDWVYLTDSMVELSDSIQNTLGDGYTLQIVNPFNEENTLLTVQNGSKIYDAFDE